MANIHVIYFLQITVCLYLYIQLFLLCLFHIKLYASFGYTFVIYLKGIRRIPYVLGCLILHIADAYMNYTQNASNASNTEYTFPI